MGRRIAACAALLALMVTLSACCCKGGIVSTTPSAAAPKTTMIVAKPAHAGTVVVMSAPAGRAAPMGGMEHMAAAGPAREPAAKRMGSCKPYHNRNACYVSESDRDMGRTRDDLPPGGRCWDDDDSSKGSDGHHCGAGCSGCPKCDH